MNDEPPSSSVPQARSWLDRLGQMLSGEPRNREELLEELRNAKDNGLLSADTLAMIEGVITVPDKQVSDVMVPRAQMISVPVDGSLTDILKIVIETGHSRFPVTGEDRDEIIGTLLAKDLLKCLAEPERPCDIRNLIRPVRLIPESKRLNVLLKEFRSSRHHLAVVVDEYGGVAGLVTIEDVLEEIVGDIDDEHDDESNPDAQIRLLPDGRHSVSALTPIADFNSAFGSDLSDEEYDTVGGLVTAQFGHLPEVGEETAIGRFRFQVSKADVRRVHQFLVATVSA
jgi:magnesium and cobalt transporter